MGWLLLIWRLVRGDIKRRWVQSLMLVVMIAATTATLTLSLALQGVTDSPFAHTRAATKGPDVAGLFEPDFHGTAGTLTQFEALAHAPGVTESSGLFPVTESELTYDGHKMRVHAEGRDSDQAALDQPLLIAGHWTTPDGVVIERNFADALGVHVGDTIRLGGRVLTVRGIAVTSAMPTSDPLVWLNTSTLLALADRSQPLWYAINLKLADPASAEAFAAAHNTPNAAWALQSWQEIRADDSTAIADERQLLVMGSVLLAIIAVAGIAVMVGGRMAEQTRRVGLLKAVGATPRLVALILMAENLLLAAAGTIAGLTVGRLVAPALTNPGASLIGNAGTPTLNATTIVLAGALAAVVALAATGVPALRGARTSTIKALNDPARPPQRHDGMIGLSARLPVPLLLGVRLIARRPRRTQLAIASVAIAVATFIATLMMRHTTVLGVKDRRQHPRRSQTGQPRSRRQHPQRDPRHHRRDQPPVHHLGHRPRRATTHRPGPITRRHPRPDHRRPGQRPTAPWSDRRRHRHPHRAGALPRRRGQPHPSQPTDPHDARRDPRHPARHRHPHRDPRPPRRQPSRRRSPQIRMKRPIRDLKCPERRTTPGPQTSCVNAGPGRQLPGTFRDSWGRERPCRRDGQNLARALGRSVDPRLTC